MEKKFMNKMDNMEMDKVAGGKHSGCVRKLPIEKAPIAGGHKIILAENVNASACVR